MHQTENRYLEANLSVLSERFPKAAQEICRADASQLSPLDDTEEQAAAPKVLHDFQALLNERLLRLYLLAGFGTSTIARTLFKASNGFNVGILVMEPDAALMKQVCSLQDLRDLFQCKRFYLICGNTLLEQAEQVIEQEALCTVPGLCLLFRQVPPTPAAHARFTNLAQELALRKQRVEAALNQKVVEFLNRPRRITVSAMRKVWICERSYQSAEHSRAQQHLALCFARAFEQAGWQVYSPQFEPEAYYAPYYPVHSLMQCDPDLVILLNLFSTDAGVLGTNFSTRLAIPKVSWFVDTPLTFRSVLQEQGFCPGDILASSDAHWFEDVHDAATEISSRPVHLLPLAATYDEPGELDDSWACDVSYVGQVLDQRSLFQNQQANTSALEGLNRIVNSILRHPRLRPSELVEADPLLRQLSERGNLLEVLRQYYRELIWEANSRCRVRTLMTLADLDLKVYGNPDWRTLTQGTPLEYCFTGRTVAHEDLPRLYRNSRININIHHLQSSTSLNLRVFDVPAAEGFLLTDSMPGLENYFEIGREVEVYRTPEELREKVLYYLQHPEERLEIARRGRERVLREHRFAHRVGTLMDILRKEGWG